MCTNQRKSGESISNCILIEQELEMTDKHVKIVDFTNNIRNIYMWKEILILIIKMTKIKETIILYWQYEVYKYYHKL